MSDNEEFLLDGEEPVKKGPGRPKKRVIRKYIPKIGIVNEPCNISLNNSHPSMVNALEIVYDNPTMFKKIFQLYSMMDAESVRLRFEKNYIKIFATDHTGKNKIYTKIYSNRLNRYYCENVLEVGCETRRIDKKLATLTKDHGEIHIYTDRRSKNSAITISLINDEMQEESVDFMEINDIEDYNWDVEDILKKEISYPVKFTVPSKYFKKKISDFSKGCEILRIEKTGNEYLRFNYTHGDKKGKHDSYYKDHAKIRLDCSIEEDDIFSTSVCVDDIQPFSSALISDEVHISADKFNDLILSAYLDQDEFVEDSGKNKKNKNKKYKIYDTHRSVIKVIVPIVKSSMMDS
jgi:hypothetical protein